MNTLGYTGFMEFTMDCEINKDLCDLLFGVDLAEDKDKTGFAVVYDQEEKIQVRRHRKKRINKKWAKRYGFKTITRRYQLNDCVVECDVEDGVFAIKGNNVSFDILGGDDA